MELFNDSKNNFSVFPPKIVSAIQSLIVNCDGDYIGFFPGTSEHYIIVGLKGNQQVWSGLIVNEAMKQIEKLIKPENMVEHPKKVSYILSLGGNKIIKTIFCKRPDVSGKDSYHFLIKGVANKTEGLEI